MKKFKYLIGSASMFVLPFLVSAEDAAGDPVTTQGLADGPSAGGFQVLLQNILELVNTVLIPFIIGIGFLVFVWGMFQFFIAGGANDEAKAKGKSLMIYATLGFVLIIIFWGVINLLTQSTGLEGETTKSIPVVDIPFGS